MNHNDPKLGLGVRGTKGSFRRTLADERGTTRDMPPIPLNHKNDTAHTYINEHIHTYIHTYIHTDRQTDRQTDRHIYIYIYTYIYIYVSTVL